MIECIGGFLLASFSTSAITRLVNTLTQEELIEDPHDFIATHLLSLAQQFTASTRHFYAFYLLSHGVIKVFLVIGLLKNKLWSYPVSLAVLGLFIIYQLYRFSYEHGLGLLVLTGFDGVVMGLVWHEYRLIRATWDCGKIFMRADVYSNCICQIAIDLSSVRRRTENHSTREYRVASGRDV